MRSIAVLCFALAALPASAAADSLEEIFERANAAYFRGDYEGAAEGYRRLVELGVVDADVAFNLATAEARRGRYGAAAQFYERTLWLRPGDADAHRGLDAARTALGRRLAEASGEGEVDTAPPLSEALLGGVGRTTLAVVTLVTETLLFAVLLGLLFARREAVRLGLGIAAPLLAVVALVAGVGWALRAGVLEDGEPAVVVERSTPLREGPDAHAEVRHHAREGQRAWVVDRERSWARVRVPDLGEGWVASEHVGLVRP